jgi:hypothetical protein
MSIQQFCAWLESTRFATLIRTSTWMFPTIETIHVLFIVLVVGNIARFDLRLLSLAYRDRKVTEVYDEVVPWTWVCFGLAALAGFLLFSSHATTYYHNFPFRMKMLLLLMTGVNTAIFQQWTYSTVDRWDHEAAPPPAAKFAGGISLVFWIFIVAFGRWIGFTT